MAAPPVRREREAGLSYPHVLELSGGEPTRKSQALEGELVLLRRRRQAKHRGEQLERDPSRPLLGRARDRIPRGPVAGQPRKAADQLGHAQALEVQNGLDRAVVNARHGSTRPSRRMPIAHSSPSASGTDPANAARAVSPSQWALSAHHLGPTSVELAAWLTRKPIRHPHGIPASRRRQEAPMSLS